MNEEVKHELMMMMILKIARVQKKNIGKCFSDVEKNGNDCGIYRRERVFKLSNVFKAIF